jgi:hypothetical protein
MASDEQWREIDEKMTALVRVRFDEDFWAAFAHSDANGNGMIDNDALKELKELLRDAGIGIGLTRWVWAKRDYRRGQYQRRPKYPVEGESAVRTEDRNAPPGPAVIVRRGPVEVIGTAARW